MSDANKTLTDEQILAAFPANMGAVRVPPGWRAFARNIEALVASRFAQADITTINATQPGDKRLIALLTEAFGARHQAIDDLAALILRANAKALGRDGAGAKIREAIADYHYALDTRQHGGMAQSNAFNRICEAVDMHWQQGTEKARRDAAAQPPSSTTGN